MNDSDLTVCLDGVYKAGFATSFNAYRAAVVPLFEALDKVEAMLAGKTYLIGNRLTEADIRLYVTIVSAPVLPSTGSQANETGEDPLRPCLCLAFQVQPLHHPARVP